MSAEKAIASTYQRIADLAAGLRWVLAALFILLLISYFCTSVHAPSVYWHLLVGQFIVQQGALPEHNWFTLLAAGRPYYTESWLFDLLLAWAYQQMNAHGLLLVKYLLLALFFATAAWVFFQRSAALFLTCFLLAVLGAGLFARSELSVETFGVVTVLVTAHVTLRTEPLSARCYLFAVLPLGILAANVYLPPVLAVGLILAVLSVLLCGFTLLSTRSIVNGAVLRHLVFLTTCVLLATLCTPYVGENLWYLIDKWRAYFHYVFLSSEEVVGLSDYRIAVLCLLAATMWAMSGLRASMLKTAEVYAVVFLVLLAMCAKTLSPYCLVLGSLCFIRFASRPQSQSSKVGEGLEQLATMLSRAPAFATMFVLASIIFVSLAKLYTHPLSLLLLPSQELEQLTEDPQLKEVAPLFHPSVLGGYVGFYFAQAAPFNVSPSIGQRAAFAEQLRLYYPEYLVYDRWNFPDSKRVWERLVFDALGARSALLAKNHQQESYFETLQAWCEMKAAGDSLTQYSKSSPRSRELAGIQWRMFIRQEPPCPERRVRSWDLEHSSPVPAEKRQ